MEVIGFDAEAAQEQALAAVLGILLVFTFISPIGGMLMHRVIRRFVPADEVWVLAGTALIIFILCFALLFGILLRVPAFANLNVLLMLFISLFGAGFVTTITAGVLRYIFQRDAKRMDPEAHTFGVWQEDARRRPKNLRRK